jgi:hypothetical protein
MRDLDILTITIVGTMLVTLLVFTLGYSVGRDSILQLNLISTMEHK